MGQTIVEKILSRNYGADVYAGDEELFSPDYITSYDYPGYIDSYENQLVNELGITSVKHPEKFVLFIDHFNPAGARQFRDVHVKTRNFAKKFGMTLFEDKGIGHQVLAEEGYVVPGELIVHFDGHVSTLGAYGCYALSMRNSIIEAYATEKVLTVVPSSIRVELKDKLNKGIGGRDVFHHLLKELGPAGCLGSVIEYGGEGLANLTLDMRLTICNLSMFLGANSSIMETDDEVDEFLKDTARKPYERIYSDTDANYVKVIELNLGDVEPTLAAPPSPSNIIPISDVEGMTVNVGYLGSCACGRMSDFRQAYEILEGKRVDKGFHFYGVPASTKIQTELAKTGLMEKLINAGVCMYYPSCDFCYGQLGVLADGEVALSTATLNVPGRMGNVNSDIYLSSVYTLAASSLTGKITDPRKLF
jgi:3-isopropylmalate/(R)-2-methylmalate dehydratase large subunit